MSNTAKKIVYWSVLGLMILTIAQPLTNVALGQNNFSSTTQQVVDELQGQVDEETGGNWNCGFFNIFCWGTSLINFLFLSLGYAIGYVTAAFIGVVVYILQIVVQISADLSSNILVQTGFEITLNLANLGFVLAIIFIGIATILRLEKYKTKDLLWKLIVAAILINFSFAIVGVVTDFVNILGNTFLNAINEGSWINFGENMAHSLSLQKLAPSTFQPTGEALADLGKIGPAFYANIASLLATGVFSALILITFAMLTFMLLARLVILMILLILMPLAWLSLVLPGMSGYFSEWWSNFFKWSFFYPAVMLFVYIAIKSSEGVGAAIGAASSGQAGTAAGSLAGLGSEVITAIVQIVVQCAILIGGIMAAQKFGIMGADTAMKFAGNVKGWALGKAGKVALAPVKQLGEQPTRAGARRLTNVLGNKWVRWVPGAKGLSNTLAGFGVKGRQEQVEKARKEQYGNLSDAQLEKQIASPPLLAENRAALLAETAKRGKTDKYSQENLATAIEATKHFNPGMEAKDIPVLKETLKKDPTMAPLIVDMKKYTHDKDGKEIGGMVDDKGKPTETARAAAIRDTVQKAKAGDVINWNPKIFEDMNVIMNLNNGALGAIIASGSEAQRRVLKKIGDDLDRAGSSSELSSELQKKYGDDFTRVGAFLNANVKQQSNKMPAINIAVTEGGEKPTATEKAPESKTEK